MSDQPSALEEYMAHVPRRPEHSHFGWKAACGCHSGGPGWIAETVRSTGEGMIGDPCPIGAKLWKAVRKESSIVLNHFGEALAMYPGVTPERWDAFQLSTCVGVHDFCNGFVDASQVSNDWSALHCRLCGLRVHVPAELKNIGELRAWADRSNLRGSIHL